MQTDRRESALVDLTILLLLLALLSMWLMPMKASMSMSMSVSMIREEVSLKQESYARRTRRRRSSEAVTQ